MFLIVSTEYLASASLSGPRDGSSSRPQAPRGGGGGGDLDAPQGCLKVRETVKAMTRCYSVMSYEQTLVYSVERRDQLVSAVIDSQTRTRHGEADGIAPRLSSGSSSKATTITRLQSGRS